MPSAATISLVTADETIVFTPESITGTHVLFQNNAVADLAKRELLHFDRPADEKTTVRRSVRVNIPLVRTVGGVEVLSQASVKVEFVAPRDSTTAERKRLRLIIEKAVANAATLAIVDVPEWFY